MIQSLDHCSSDEVETAKVVLRFLEHHSKLLLDEVPGLRWSLEEASKTHAWVPFVRCRPSQYPQALRLFSENCENVLCTPSDVSSAKYCNLVGSVQLLVDTAQVPNLAQIFLWNDDPDAEVVISHLLNVSADYIPNETATFTLILREIYDYLNKQDLMLE